MGAGQHDRPQPGCVLGQNVARALITRQRQEFRAQIRWKAHRMARRAILGHTTRDGLRILGPDRKAALQIFGGQVGQISEQQKHWGLWLQIGKARNQAGRHASAGVRDGDAGKGKPLDCRQTIGPVRGKGEGNTKPGCKGSECAAPEQWKPIDQLQKLITPPHAGGGTSGEDQNFWCHGRYDAMKKGAVCPPGRLCRGKDGHPRGYLGHIEGQRG